MSDNLNDKLRGLAGINVDWDKVMKPTIVTPAYRIESDIQKTSEMIQNLQKDKIRKEVQKEMEEERRHQEMLESNRTIANALSTAVAQGKSVTITIQDSNITNLQQNIEANGNVQNNYANQGIELDALISSLHKIFEHLLTQEEQEEANEAVAELKDTIEANEQPKKGVVNFLKSLVRRVIENPIALAKGANVILDEGKEAIDTLQNLIS